MKIIRTKRPDKIIVTFDNIEVELTESNDVTIYIRRNYAPGSIVTVKHEQIPNLIKALKKML